MTIATDRHELKHRNDVGPIRTGGRFASISVLISVGDRLLHHLSRTYRVAIEQIEQRLGSARARLDK